MVGWVYVFVLDLACFASVAPLKGRAGHRFALSAGRSIEVSCVCFRRDCGSFILKLASSLKLRKDRKTCLFARSLIQEPCSQKVLVFAQGDAFLGDVDSCEEVAFLYTVNKERR